MNTYDACSKQLHVARENIFKNGESSSKIYINKVCFNNKRKIATSSENDDFFS